MVARSSRSEEHTSELQSPCNLVCRLLLEKKKRQTITEDAFDLKPPVPRTRFVLHCLVVRCPTVHVLVLQYYFAHVLVYLLFFFFNDTATTEIYTLSLHDALPIYFGFARRIMSLSIKKNPWRRMN